MSNLKLDTATHDLVIENFNFQLTADTDESVAQNWKVRLLFFIGEWFLNENFGVPYYQEILKKQSDTTIVDSIIREQTLQTPGIEEIIQYNSNFDTAARRFDVEIKVRSQTDAELILTFSGET